MTGEGGRLGSKEWSERSSVASPSPEWVLSSCHSSNLELQPHFNRKTIRIKFCQFFTNLELDSSTSLWALTKPAVEQILLFWCLHVDLKNVSRSWIEKSFAVNSFSDYKALELLLQRDSTVAAVSNSTPHLSFQNQSRRFPTPVNYKRTQGNSTSKAMTSRASMLEIMENRPSQGLLLHYGPNIRPHPVETGADQFYWSNPALQLDEVVALGGEMDFYQFMNKLCVWVGGLTHCLCGAGERRGVISYFQT